MPNDAGWGRPPAARDSSPAAARCNRAESGAILRCRVSRFPDDHLQEIVEVVGNAPHGFHLLGLPYRLLVALQVFGALEDLLFQRGVSSRPALPRHACVPILRQEEICKPEWPLVDLKNRLVVIQDRKDPS
jgi:hypothetical protein